MNNDDCLSLPGYTLNKNTAEVEEIDVTSNTILETITNMSIASNYYDNDFAIDSRIQSIGFKLSSKFIKDRTLFDHNMEMKLNLTIMENTLLDILIKTDLPLRVYTQKLRSPEFIRFIQPIFKRSSSMSYLANTNEDSDDYQLYDDETLEIIYRMYYSPDIKALIYIAHDRPYRDDSYTFPFTHTLKIVQFPYDFNIAKKDYSLSNKFERMFFNKKDNFPNFSIYDNYIHRYFKDLQNEMRYYLYFKGRNRHEFDAI